MITWATVRKSGSSECKIIGLFWFSDNKKEFKTSNWLLVCVVSYEPYVHIEYQHSKIVFSVICVHANTQRFSETTYFVTCVDTFRSTPGCQIISRLLASTKNTVQFDSLVGALVYFNHDPNGDNCQNISDRIDIASISSGKFKWCWTISASNAESTTISGELIKHLLSEFRESSKKQKWLRWHILLLIK